ncbi:MAG: hypothetical protein A2Z86_03495 [Candidatus Glassbacteria bacterium GWA2_58_10]|uniref:nicotinamidase n=2 Tax=Candidatus Glassiibacteriota TaxID=1817805 RepID=A0A1F5YC99_9BACT|nr:MAG: hypothetical protein A2Z86_03495 [Candidatus Glassbacteria bacterium GWA2_58_10]
MQDALLVVDMQVDFCAGGALAAHDTVSMLETVNALIDEYTDKNKLVIFSRDWHPSDHCSFREQGGQWPTHCVAGTPGAEFHPRLRLPSCSLVVSKATARDKEAYSAFDGTGLAALLDNLGIQSLALCGIATEYCVRATFEDAVRNNFHVIVRQSAIRPVSPGSPEEKEALGIIQGA